MSVHEKIKLLRETKGLTQEQLAEELKMSASAYGDIERGDSDIKLSRLQKIANFFEIKLSELFELSERESLIIINSLNPDNKNSICNKSKIYIGSSASELEKQLLINKAQAKELIMKDREIENLGKIITLLEKTAQS